MNPIPVYVLTGFLGSGKTTLLNRLLGHFANLRPGLIINEFGALGIDAQRLIPGKHEIVELNKGSVFCICLKTDLMAALKRMSGDVRPGVILIEATGVAEPADFEEILSSPGLADAFRLKGNLCVIDSLNFTKAAAFAQSLRHQVEFADGLILNKADLISDSQMERLTSLLLDMNPLAKQTICRFGEIADEFVDNLSHRKQTGALVKAPPANLSSISLRPTDKIERALFWQTVRSLGPALLRLKGNVEFEDGLFFVEAVLGETTERRLDRAGYPGFTLIGWKMNTAQVERTFESLWV